MSARSRETLSRASGNCSAARRPTPATSRPKGRRSERDQAEEVRMAHWTVQTVGMSWDILDRMERAVAKVRERLLRATAALNKAGVPYAVVGGNAVASWVATVDEGAVRNTRDVDLLVRRSDLPAITSALEQAGFVRDELLDVIMFRDGPQGRPSEAIH